MNADPNLRNMLLACAAESGSYPADRFSGCGIVICAGGGAMLTNAYVLLRVLRETLNCTLPIEVWHLGPKEMPQLISQRFHDLGCNVVDAVQVMQRWPADVTDGWQLKPYALIHSSFEQVLLLDADQVPVCDPAQVFDWPAFKETGAVFWPDLIDISEQNPLWAMLGLPARRIRSLETGQVCIDKARHWASLAMVLRMNERAGVFYRVVYGDKDTFLAAWLLSEADFHVIGHPPLADPRCLGQRDPAGSLIFQHRTNCKWRLDGANYRPDGFVFHNECEAFLAELGSFWNGLDFLPPDRSAKARAVESSLLEARRFYLRVDQEADIDVELLEGHQIGQGRSPERSNWCVVDGDSGLRLVLYNLVSPSLVFDAIEMEMMPGQTVAQTPRPASLRMADFPAGAGLGESGSGLVDAFIDVFLHGGPVPATSTELSGALAVLARLEAGVRDKVMVRARTLETSDSCKAEVLSQIAGKLPADRVASDSRPDKSVAAMLDDPRLYRR